MLKQQNTRQNYNYIASINQMRRGALTIPIEMRKEAKWDDGHFFEIIFDKKTQGIYIYPKRMITKKRFIELSKKGEEMLQTALKEVKSGKTKTFDTAEDLIKDLRT